jgi:hypothetical protein
MIFLSHSWNDKPVARRIVEALAERGIPVWLDEQQLQANAVLRTELLQAIAGSHVYVYLLSEQANRSEWVQEELQYAIKHEGDHLAIVVVRAANDHTTLPDLLAGRLYHDLSTDKGGVAKLAHELSEMPDAGVLPEGARTAATVRLALGRVVHTLAVTNPLDGSPSLRHVLLLDERYERLDLRYWRLAEQALPERLQGEMGLLAEAGRAIDAIHAQCRRMIDGVAELAKGYAEYRTSDWSAYYVAAIERALYVLVHRLEWNCRYLACWKGEGAFGEAEVAEKYPAEPFSGHLVDFVSDGRGMGKARVPTHGSPWPTDMPVVPWGLSSPFFDMSRDDVGTAIGEIVVRRFLAGTLSTLDLPDPTKLEYGLG